MVRPFTAILLAGQVAACLWSRSSARPRSGEASTGWLAALSALERPAAGRATQFNGPEQRCLAQEQPQHIQWRQLR